MLKFWNVLGFSFDTFLICSIMKSLGKIVLGEVTKEEKKSKSVQIDL